MTNLEQLEALGMRVFPRTSIEGEVTGFAAQGGVPIVNKQVRREPGESEEDALGRLLELVQAELS